MNLFKCRNLILKIYIYIYIYIYILGENKTYLVQSLEPEDDNVSVETCSSLL